MSVAARMQRIQPFHVMALLARARELEAAGRSVIHMEIGEPDFVTPQPVIEAGQAALASGLTHYTPATGLPALRARIARFYQERYGVEVDPQRIVITPGASSALQLVLAATVDAGARVLLTDPGYPCNRNFVHLLNAEPVALPVTVESGWQPTARQVRDSWRAGTRALLLASPSNPTGTLLAPDTIRAYLDITRAADATLIIDEIYHGLTYGDPVPTALAISDEICVINSFSKYFGMTGWRLGWLVAPVSLVPELDKLAQNMYLAAPTVAQHAALRAFDADTIAILEERRAAFRQRRDYLLPALRALGFGLPVQPDGAFYLYADCSRFTDDSFAFCVHLLEEIGVAITPGIDFGEYRAQQHVRFAYTTALEKLQEGVRRLREYLS